jgi:hypothetical protein
MAEQIGIRLNLQGASQVQGGLQGVVRSLGELDSKTLKVGDAFKALGPQLAAALSVGTIAAWLKSAVDAVDAMNDLADATGSTVEEISKLDRFARTTGTTLDAVGGIMVKFNQVLKDADGTNAVSQALRAINVDVAALRRADPVDALQQTARALAGFADDANKARVVQELFGKSVREAAPILKDLADAGTLQASVTAKQAAEAEKFNRALAAFKNEVSDVARLITQTLLPTLNNWFGQLSDGMATYGSFTRALGDIAFNIKPWQSLNENLAETVKDITLYRNLINELKSSRLPDPFGARARQITEYQTRLDNAIAREQYLLRQQGREGGRAADPRARPTERPSIALPAPGAAGAAAAANAERDIRARQDLARLAREDAAQAAADEAARRAAQLQLEADEKDSLNRLLRYDRAVADAEAAHQAELERIAQDALRQQARYDDATLAAEQASAEAFQRELELQADRALAQQVREYDAERAADAAIKAEREVRAAQDLAAIARYDAAELAAEAAHQRELQQQAEAALAERELRAAQDLAAIARYDAAELAAEAAHQRELQLQADIALAALVREYEAEEEATREYLRQREAYAEYLLTLQDQITQAQIQDAAAVQKYLDDQTEAQKRATDAVTARTEQLQLEAQAADRAVVHNISLAEAIELVTIQRLREQQARYVQGSEGWQQIEREINARQKLLGVMGQQRAQQANVDAAREAAAQWERTVDQVGQSLADALMSGGKSAGEALKRYFSTLVLQPIIKAIVDPVARSVLALLGFGGATGAATAGNAAAGGSAPGLLGSLGVSAAQMSAYGGLFTSAAQLAGTSWAGTGLAAMHSIGAPLGQGLAMGAGTIAGALGPIAIGQMLGRGISGGYSAIGGRSGSSAVNLGTGIGALFGPIGAGIGAVVGGLVNRAFGRKLVDTGVQGSFGGEQGFTGSQFEFLRGGWFRSDKTRTSALSGDLQSILGGGFNQLRDETVKMARDLGLASESVTAFTKDIKLSLKGLTQEQIQQKLAQELGLVADEMARLAGGAGMTASSLRQLYQQVMSERAQLETQLLQLQGDTAELRRREREAIHESNRALYDRIIALQDERAQLAAATSAAADALARQISASQSAANAARQAADAYAQAGSSLRQTIAALLGTGSPGASAASAYRSGLAAAQAGDVTAMGNLGALASSYAESLRGTARTRAEANIGAARIAAELQGVAALSDTLGTQRSAQAALLNVNTAALQVLQEDLQNGDLTVELLREHSTNLQQIAAALAANGVVVGQLQSNDQTTGGVIDEQARAADLLASSDLTLARVLAKLGEADPTNLLLVDRISSGNTLVADRLSALIGAVNAQTAAQQAEVERQQNLQRAQADLQSAAAYLGSLQGNVQTAQATLAGTPATTSVRVGTRYDWLGFAKGGIYEQRDNPAFAAAQQAEAEAQAALRAYEPQVQALRDLITSLGGVPAFALGGLHSGGLRIVGERGPELEATGPARYWSAADTAAMLGNSQRREELLAAEIRALRAELQGLRAEARVTAVATNKVQRLWERVTRDGESMQIVDVTPTP